MTRHLTTISGGKSADSTTLRESTDTAPDAASEASMIVARQFATVRRHLWAVSGDPVVDARRRLDADPAVGATVALALGVRALLDGGAS